MANLNKVFLMGNLTRDPEMKYTPSGTGICAFSVAVNRKWKDKTGGYKEEVAFVDCEAWGGTGEMIAAYLRKGNSIFVEGRLRFSQWEAKDGGKRSKLSVTVENFQFVGGQDAGSPRGNEPEGENIPF